LQNAAHDLLFPENNVLIIEHIPAAIGLGVEMAVFKKVLPWLDVCTCWQKILTDPRIWRRKNHIQRNLTPRLGLHPRLTVALLGMEPAGIPNLLPINPYFSPDFTSPLN
jgi:hypothetical protein